MLMLSLKASYGLKQSCCCNFSASLDLPYHASVNSLTTGCHQQAAAHSLLFRLSGNRMGTRNRDSESS